MHLKINKDTIWIGLRRRTLLLVNHGYPKLQENVFENIAWKGLINSYRFKPTDPTDGLKQ